MNNFENEAFQPCKEWIAGKIESGSMWDEITVYGKDASILEELKDEELFPLCLLWYNILVTARPNKI